MIFTFSFLILYQMNSTYERKNPIFIYNLNTVFHDVDKIALVMNEFFFIIFLNKYTNYIVRYKRVCYNKITRNI